MRIIRGAGAARAGRDSSADSGRKRRYYGESSGEIVRPLLGDSSPRARAISARTSANLARRFVATATNDSRATACGNWSSRCWSGNSIPQSPRISPNSPRSHAEKKITGRTKSRAGSGRPCNGPRRIGPVRQSADGLVQIAGLENSRSSVKSPTSHANDVREMGHPSSDAPLDSDLQSQHRRRPLAGRERNGEPHVVSGEPVAVQRRLVKAIGERAGIPLEFKHVEEILHLPRRNAARIGAVASPGLEVAPRAEELIFVTPDLRDPLAPQDYDHDLPGSRPNSQLNEIRLVLRGSAYSGRRAARGIIQINFSMRTSLPETVTGAELASRRSLLAGSYEVPQEDQGIAAGASCGAAGAQALAGE